MNCAVIFSEHKAFVKELARGVVVATTPEIYDHFLNVLPPLSMTRSSFTFREGDERIAFWKMGDACYARLTRGMVGTPDYEYWAEYRLEGSLEAGEYQVSALSVSLQDSSLNGKRFATLEAAVEALTEAAKALAA